MKHSFSITRSTNPKQKPNPDKLVFGETFTDHMFIMDYSKDKGWHDGRIVPYGPISLEPAAAVFQYAIEMFEGMKAYRTDTGKVQLFRPDMNIKRTNNTNDRICVPRIDPDLMLDAIKAIVDFDRDWIPDRPGTSLYIRPFIIADEPYLGVHPAKHFLFIIILSPVGSYYGVGGGSNQLPATKIYVEDKYARTAVGGTGAAKIGANYVISLKAQEEAAEKGYDQVLWLDSAEKKYVQEIGTSNAFFVINNEVITAPLDDGTILPGITRDSCLALLRKWGIPCSERPLTIEAVYQAAEDGTLNEVFASGTAAVISPVGEICWKGKKIPVKTGPIAQRLYDELTGIQTGKIPDTMGWTVEVEKK